MIVSRKLKHSAVIAGDERGGHPRIDSRPQHAGVGPNHRGSLMQVGTEELSTVEYESPNKSNHRGQSLSDRRERIVERAFHTTRPVKGERRFLGRNVASYEQKRSCLFEIARVLVRFDHVSSVIVNANHSIM